MDDLDDALFRDAIAAQRETFCSHDIIEYFYRREQPAYVRELSTKDAPYPITEAHRQIGLQLLRRYPDLVTKEPQQCDHPTQAACWRKVSPGGP